MLLVLNLDDVHYLIWKYIGSICWTDFIYSKGKEVELFLRARWSSSQNYLGRFWMVCLYRKAQLILNSVIKMPSKSRPAAVF